MLRFEKATLLEIGKPIIRYLCRVTGLGAGSLLKLQCD